MRFGEGGPRILRNIDPKDFRVARRGTSRAINRQIALTLIRTQEPLSRADLARLMKVRRGAVGLLVNELIAEGLIFEGAKGEAKRGRKPHFLYVDSRGRCVVAVDVRASRTFLVLTDMLGRPIVEISSFPTVRDPVALVRELAQRIRRLLDDHAEAGKCYGVGVVVPGMVDHKTSRVLQAPTLGWRDVDLRPALASATGFPVHVENSGKACVLAQMWAGTANAGGADIVFVNISDGVGVGIIVNGELLRGRHNVAGEFGHVPLSIDGPRCTCGASGCWETYVSNLATLSRYFGRTVAESAASPDVDMTVDDLIARARGGDAKAVATLQSTARYLGLGLGSIVNALDPARIYLSGEITGAWDLIETIVRAGLDESALGPTRGLTEIAVVPVADYPRLRGAATLVVIPTFAAPALA
jgi:N-acetylglucosamine repressor